MLTQVFLSLLDGAPCFPAYAEAVTVCSVRFGLQAPGERTIDGGGNERAHADTTTNDDVLFSQLNAFIEYDCRLPTHGRVLTCLITATVELLCRRRVASFARGTIDRLCIR